MLSGISIFLFIHLKVYFLFLKVSAFKINKKLLIIFRIIFFLFSAVTTECFFSFLKINLFLLLKDNSFTEFCCFLSNLNMNQPSVQFSSVIQSCLTLCDPMNPSTLGPPVHDQLPEFTQTRVLSWWCHPAISSSVVPFSSCPQSLPALGSFPMSQLFTWGGPKYWSLSLSISP